MCWQDLVSGKIDFLRSDSIVAVSRGLEKDHLGASFDEQLWESKSIWNEPSLQDD